MKFLKWALLAAVILVLLLVGAVGLVVATLDPNDYKDEISEQVQELTGRKLTLDGDIQWSVFPWLGLNLGEASLSNAEGFGDTPFASLSEVNVQVALTPLLKKQVVARNIVLRGVSLNLQKKKNGTDNWSDLAKSSEAGGSETTEAAAPAKGSLADDLQVDITGLEIVDANLSYVDEQAGQRISVNALNVSTSALQLAQPVKVTSNFKVGINDLDLAVDLAGELTVNPETGEYAFSNLVVHQTASGQSVPSGEQSGVARMNIAANTETQVLDIDDLSVDVLGLSVQGKLQLSQFLQEPRYSGELSSNTFDLRKLVEQLGQSLPVTANPAVLGSTSIKFDFAGDTKRLGIKPLLVKMDKSRLEGHVNIDDLSTQALRFDLALDAINVDDYLPKAAEPSPVTEKAAPAQPGATEAADTIALPLDVLRSLQMDGSLRVGQLTVSKLLFEKANMVLKAKGGVISIEPLTAEAYEGKASINARLDVRADTPKYSTKIDMSGVQSGDIFETLLGDRIVSGTATVAADLSTSGDRVSALKQGLNGSVQVKFSEGTIKGSKLSEKILEARNFVRKLEGKGLLENKVTDSTQFSVLTATADVTGGQLKNDDLSLLAPLFHASGKGVIDLAKDSMDYTLGLGRPPKEGKEGAYVPLKIFGPFSDLSFKLALDDVAEDYAKEALRKKEAELKAKAEAEKARLKKKADEEKARLKQKADEEKAKLEAEGKEKLEKKKSELEEKLKKELDDSLKKLFK